MLHMYTLAGLYDITARALSVIETSDGADEHGELIHELRTLTDTMQGIMEGSHMGTAADEPILTFDADE